MIGQTFGIEIETTQRSRGRVARAIQSVVGGFITHVGYPRCYDTWEVQARDGRIWKVMADSSLSAPRHLQAEIVSPILKREDIPMLQEVVRAARRAGCVCDPSCGIHLHLGKKSFTPGAVRNLVKIIHKHERHIEHALGVTERRKARWCKPIKGDFMARLEAKRDWTWHTLNEAWYGDYNPRPYRYHSSRYSALNLNAAFFGPTIELRSFEATLHAGKVKAYVQLALALGEKAIKARSASSKRRPFNPATARYDFRTFLLGLGMVGPEYKTARLHLLSRLDGCSAWKNGRPDGGEESGES